MRLLRDPLSTPQERPPARRPLARFSRPFLLLATLVCIFATTFIVRSAFFDRGATATAGLDDLLATSAPLLVFSELGQAADIVWAADPNDPATRTEIAAIEHGRGYGIAASVSPDGAYLAYVAVPPSSADPSEAELWLIDIHARQSRRLATQVDLSTTPEWSPAIDAIAVRSLAGDTSALVSVALDGSMTTLVGNADAAFPIDFGPTGETLYYATFAGGTSYLGRAGIGGAAGSGPEVIAELGPGFSRDWSLSPDGTQIAYLGQTSGDRIVYDARVFDIEEGTVSGAVAALSGSQFNPVWDPEGGLTVGSAPNAGVAGASAHVSEPAGEAVVLPAPSAGFDVPLTWAPGGSHLVIREFEGSSASDPGASHIVVINAGGERLRVSNLSDVLVAGWLE